MAREGESPEPKVVKLLGLEVKVAEVFHDDKPHGYTITFPDQALSKELLEAVDIAIHNKLVTTTRFERVSTANNVITVTLAKGSVEKQATMSDVVGVLESLAQRDEFASVEALERHVGTQKAAELARNEQQGGAWVAGLVESQYRPTADAATALLIEALKNKNLLVGGDEDIERVRNASVNVLIRRLKEQELGRLQSGNTEGRG